MDMSVDQELVMCGVLCMEETCGELGSGSCVEEMQGGGGDDDDEAEPEAGQVLRKRFVRLSP
jgi:hypothetical protein